MTVLTCDTASCFGLYKATVTRTTRITATGGTGEWREESRDPLQRSVRTEWNGTTPVASRTYFSNTAASGSRGRLAPAKDADGGDGQLHLLVINTGGEAFRLPITHPSSYSGFPPRPKTFCQLN